MSSLCQCEGAPCLEHPNYVFYKSFKYQCSNNGSRILTCGDFFFAKMTISAPICIGEVELVWKDVASNLLLVSVKLYFLPEHTPDGRQDDTGEDEVIGLGERLVVRLDDLIPRIHHDFQWTYGRCAYSSRASHVATGCERNRTACEVTRSNQIVQHQNGKKRNFGVDISEKGNMDSVCDSASSGAANVLVLTYPKYCRYRAVQKRLEGSENDWVHQAVVAAIGGLSGKWPGCRVMFCRETFSHIEYEELSMKMDHMLPILKDPMKGKNSKPTSQKDSQHDSDSMEENCSLITHTLPTSSRPRRSVESLDVNDEKVSTEEQAFLIGLHKFMHDSRMPIGRIPSLGFKQIDLYFFYKQAEKLGGYDMITEKRMWKRLYDQLGGNSSNTSAATCTRKHYERLLLPYEQHLYKLKVIKTKKKTKKPAEAEAEIRQTAADKSLMRAVKQEHEGPHSQEGAENTLENGNDVQVTPAVTEFSRPDLTDKQEQHEMASEIDNCQEDTEAIVARDSNNIQHMTVADTEPVPQHPPTTTAANVTVVPVVALAGEKPALSSSNMVCSGLPAPALSSSNMVCSGLPAPALSSSNMVCGGLPAPALSSSNMVCGGLPAPALSSSNMVCSGLPAPALSSSNMVCSGLPAPASSSNMVCGGLPAPALSSSNMVCSGLPAPASSSNMVCSGLPALAPHVLQTPWPVLTPVGSPSPVPPISSTQALADVVLSLPKASLRASLPEPMPSLSKNQTPMPSTVSSIENCSKLSSSPAVVCQTDQRSSPTGRRIQKVVHMDTEFQTTPVHVSQIKPPQHILPSSQQLSQNLTVSSHYLASLLHPTPAGHTCRRHLPPAPSSIYLHPTSTNQLSLLQTPTFPAPAAHCHPRKRAYPFDSCTVAAPGGTFPSPDIVLDRIRNCTSFPVSGRAVAKPSSRRQQFDDPRDIFTQIPPAVTASQISTESIRRDVRLPLETHLITNSVKHCQQPENYVSSYDSKVMHSYKAGSHTNGFISSPRSSKSVTSVSFCQSPAATTNGRLTSALFGTQFTALPRIAKPSDFSCQTTSLLDSSLPSTTAMTLNSHLHPAFVSPFLQPTTPAASPSISASLHLLAGSYSSPAHVSAYEEMLRQNGYGRFFSASTQKKGFKKK